MCSFQLFPVTLKKKSSLGCRNVLQRGLSNLPVGPLQPRPRVENENVFCHLRLGISLEETGCASQKALLERIVSATPGGMWTSKMQRALKALHLALNDHDGLGVCIKHAVAPWRRGTRLS